MIPLEDFPSHINSLTKEDWNKLFALIPKIEQTKSFGKVVIDKKSKSRVQQFPYVEFNSLGREFLALIDELKLIVVFDWMSWKEGKQMLDDKNYEGLDAVALCKLITTIVRADRFSEGYLLSAFEDGDMLTILKELKKQVQNDKEIIF
ncbi:MAG: DUF6508 domain-containing protein [Bacteroidales bacterium]|jgi:hypothetical protein|nr:DUF6508 domain-containing protein [Bacteroidales bacterium]